MTNDSEIPEIQDRYYWWILYEVQEISETTHQMSCAYISYKINDYCFIHPIDYIEELKKKLIESKSINKLIPNLILLNFKRIDLLEKNPKLISLDWILESKSPDGSVMIHPDFIKQFQRIVDRDKDKTMKKVITHVK